MTLAQKLHNYLLEGKMLRVFQLVLLFALALTWIISGIEFAEPEVEEVSTSKTVRYRIKKVSVLPPKEKSEESREIKIEETKKSLEDIRKRYVNYVVSRIEQNKVYPLKEQKLNHEGVVHFVIIVTREGSVTKFLFSQRSRYPALNSASINAVKKSIPFMKFPPQLKEKEMKIHVKMNYFLE